MFLAAGNRRTGAFADSRLHYLASRAFVLLVFFPVPFVFLPFSLNLVEGTHDVRKDPWHAPADALRSMEHPRRRQEHLTPPVSSDARAC